MSATEQGNGFFGYKDRPPAHPKLERWAMKPDSLVYVHNVTGFCIDVTQLSLYGFDALPVTDELLDAIERIIKLKTGGVT